MLTIGNWEAIGDNMMKNLFAFLLFVLITLPIFSAPRYDQGSGMGVGGGVICLIILIVGIIVSIKRQD